MRLLGRIILPLVALMFCATLTVFAQTPQDPPPGEPPPFEGPDVIGQLELTQDQIRSIRIIQRDSKDERAAIGLRLRQSNRSLQDAMDATTLDDAIVEQRLQEVASAQTAQLRMRIQTEMKIRRILTPAQLAKWHDLRLRAGDVMRAKQNQRQQERRPADRELRPNQRNGVAPLNPRRDNTIRPRP
ncbi:MAG TPA: periplasmic heavy metal sensor [Pyrinomonadaceae bacterium]